MPTDNKKAPVPAARLRRILSQARSRGQTILLLGLGNEMLGDDAVGCRVAADLAAAGLPGFHSYSAGIAVENVTHLVRETGADILFLIDAATTAGSCVSPAPAKRWDFYPADSLDTFCHTTHSVPLSLLISYWLGESPELTVHFLGIRIFQAGMFAPLSPAVEEARREIVDIFQSG